VPTWQVEQDDTFKVAEKVPAAQLTHTPAPLYEPGLQFTATQTLAPVDLAWVQRAHAEQRDAPPDEYVFRAQLVQDVDPAADANVPAVQLAH